MNEHSSSFCTLSCLDDDVLTFLMKKLQLGDIVRFSRVSKGFRSLVMEKNGVVWKDINRSLGYKRSVTLEERYVADYVILKIKNYFCRECGKKTSYSFLCSATSNRVKVCESCFSNHTSYSLMVTRRSVKENLEERYVRGKFTVRYATMMRYLKPCGRRRNGAYLYWHSDMVHKMKLLQ